jgi:hypothetical protein
MRADPRSFFTISVREHDKPSQNQIQMWFMFVKVRSTDVVDDRQSQSAACNLPAQFIVNGAQGPRL